MIELKLVDEEEAESCEDPGSTEVSRDLRNNVSALRCGCFLQHASLGTDSRVAGGGTVCGANNAIF